MKSLMGGSSKPPKELMDALQGMMNPETFEPEGEVSFERLNELMAEVITWKDKEYEVFKLTGQDGFDKAIKHIKGHEKNPRKLQTELEMLTANLETTVEELKKNVLRATVERKMEVLREEMGADELVKRLMEKTEEEIGASFSNNNHRKEHQEPSLGFGFGPSNSK